MRNISIINFVIGYLIILAWNSNKPVYSSARILNCTGAIPKKTACIIKASSYDLKIKRIDICQKNPLPNYKITPDFNGAKCINLANNTLNSETFKY